MLQWLYDMLWGTQPPGAPAVAPPARPPAFAAGAPAAVAVAAPPIAAAPHPAPPIGPVVPPPLPFPVANPPIDPGRERRDREIARFLQEIAAREASVGGHVVARHHPNLTDKQLQDRLTTGLDSAGALAVTGGISSAFGSEELFRATLRRVEELLDGGLEATRAYLRANVDAYKTTRVAAEAAQATSPGPLAKAHPLIAAHRQARNDLIAAVGVTQQGQLVRDRFMLPVVDGEVPVPGRANWSDILQKYVVVRLYSSYCITAWHRGQDIGRGFRGTSPRQAVVLGQQITVYDVVQPFLGRSDHTFTKLRVQGQHDLRIDRPHDAKDWGVTTHFPSDALQESISGA